MAFEVIPLLQIAFGLKRSHQLARILILEVVVEEGTAKDLVPGVRRMGATGIVTYPINLSIH